MTQRFVIDLSMRYMGEFESEGKARYAALGWVMDHVPDGVVISCRASRVRSEEEIFQEALSDAEPIWPMKKIILDAITAAIVDQKTSPDI